MSETPPVWIGHCRLQELQPADAPRLQRLHERCVDFCLLSEGEAPAADAGQHSFVDAPPGYTPDDLRLFGLVNAEHEICALMQVLVAYPDAHVWWLGLLLLDPAARNRGLGQGLVRYLLQAARNDGRREIQLGVLDANPAARRFWEREGFTWLRSTEPRPFGRKMHVVHVLHRVTG